MLFPSSNNRLFCICCTCFNWLLIINYHNCRAKENKNALEVEKRKIIAKLKNVLKIVKVECFRRQVIFRVRNDHNTFAIQQGIYLFIVGSNYWITQSMADDHFLELFKFAPKTLSFCIFPFCVFQYLHWTKEINLSFTPQTSQPYNSALRQGKLELTIMILTYLAVTGPNEFKTGVKWSQFPMNT